MVSSRFTRRTSGVYSGQQWYWMREIYGSEKAVSAIMWISDYDDDYVTYLRILHHARLYMEGTMELRVHSSFEPKGIFKCTN